MLTINFIYINNKKVYKLKELLKNKDPKIVINFNTILEKSFFEEGLLKDKETLIASEIIKKLKKIVAKREGSDFEIYYVLSELAINKILNLNKLVSQFFEKEILNNVYTDVRGFKKETLVNKILKLNSLKEND